MNASIQGPVDGDGAVPADVYAGADAEAVQGPHAAAEPHVHALAELDAASDREPAMEGSQAAYVPDTYRLHLSPSVLWRATASSNRRLATGIGRR